MTTLAGLLQQYGYHVAKRSFLLDDGTSLSVVGHPGGGAGYTSRVYYSSPFDMSISILAHSTVRYPTPTGASSEYRPGDCISWALFNYYAYYVWPHARTHC